MAMASTVSRRFICFYGYRKFMSDFMEWYARDGCCCCCSDNVLKLPLYKLIEPSRTLIPITVSLGSKIYCFLFAFRRVLCLDTTLPEIAWTEIDSPILNSRSSPLIVVAHGKIYVIGGSSRNSNDQPWADVFDPCNHIWEPSNLNSPPPPPPPPFDTVDDSLDCSDASFFAASLALDDDGAGVSRKVIFLASYQDSDIYVYDLEAKSWLLPRPPKLDSSFFCSTKFCHLEPACKPVLVDKTVYWYTTSRFLCAYDVETRESSVAYFQNLELMVESLPDKNYIYLSLLHLGGLRFCLIWSNTLLVFSFSKGLTNPYKVLGRPVNASILIDSVQPLVDGFELFGATIIDGMLEASKLRQRVTFLHSTPADKDHLQVECVTTHEAELEGLESVFVPCTHF